MSMVFALSTSCIAPVFAQPPDTVAALKTRLEALERELRMLRNGNSTEPAARAPAATPTSSLEERLGELDAQLRVLARQMEIDKEQAAAAARSAPVVHAARDGFSFRSADGSFRLRLRGYVQSDGRFFLGDDQRPAVDTFVMRRVRPIVEATLFNQFDFRIMPDFGGGTTVLQDAYIDARFRPDFKIRAGKFKPPFGFERLMSATELPFIERALPTALVPNRDVGVMVHGDLRAGNLAYAGGIFNGVPDGGSADADAQDGKDLVARVVMQPFRTVRDSPWQGLGAGVAVSYGVQHGSPTSTILPAFRTSGQQTLFTYLAQDATGPAAFSDGDHTRVSPQFHYYYRSYGVVGEYVYSSGNVRRGTGAAVLDNSAWQVAGTWVVTGETPSYRGVTPRAAFDPKNGTWGALEVLARYHELNVDPDTFPLFASAAASARSVDGWTLGTNWILNTGVKVSANYEHLSFTGGAANGANREAENALLTRIQIAF
jgi:phosphate-selective porin OprO/OprP